MEFHGFMLKNVMIVGVICTSQNHCYFNGEFEDRIKEVLEELIERDHEEDDFEQIVKQLVR